MKRQVLYLWLIVIVQCMQVMPGYIIVEYLDPCDDQTIRTVFPPQTYKNNQDDKCLQEHTPIKQGRGVRRCFINSSQKDTKTIPVLPSHLDNNQEDDESEETALDRKALSDASQDASTEE